MDNFKADIIAPNQKGRFCFYSLVAVIIVCVAGMVIFQVIPFIFQLFSVMIWGFLIVRYLLQTKKQVFKKAIGVLMISPNEITIHDKTNHLSEISVIKIFFSGWKSYKRSPNRNQPIEGLHSGDKNILTHTVNNRDIKCEFFLISKGHWNLLREHVVNWYKNNAMVIEDGEYGRTYGLEVLNYREIQEFKQQFQIYKNSVQ